MIIKEVTQFTAHSVKAEYGSEDHEYIRFGPDSWVIAMGESYEQVYECDKLEAAFQRFMYGSIPSKP